MKPPPPATRTRRRLLAAAHKLVAVRLDAEPAPVVLVGACPPQAGAPGQSMAPLAEQARTLVEAARG